MTDKEWEQQLDKRIRWNSFLPLLGTKAFEKLIGKAGVPPTQQSREKKQPSKDAGLTGSGDSHTTGGEDASAPEKGDL